MTLILRKGLPLGENPLVLSHHCRGLMYNSQKGITLDAAAIRSNSLWNCLKVSDWPSLIHFTADRMDSIHAGDRRACIDIESHATPRKVVLCSGESTLFLAFSRNPNSFMWEERPLYAELPTDATELESTNHRCSLLCEYPEDEEAPGPHLRISWNCRVIMLGRTEEPDICMLCPQKRTSGTSCDTEGWICGSMCPWDLSLKKNSPRIWPGARFVSKLTFWTWAAWRSRSELEDLKGLIGLSPPASGLLQDRACSSPKQATQRTCVSPPVK